MYTGMPRPRAVAYRVFRLLLDVRVASASDIAKALSMDATRVRSALRTLMRSGHVEKVGELYVLKKDVWD